MPVCRSGRLSSCLQGGLVHGAVRAEASRPHWLTTTRYAALTREGEAALVT